MTRESTTWTVDQQLQLAAAVAQGVLGADGDLDWNLVADAVSEKGAKQCRERWTQQQDPNLDTSDPREEELDLLEKLVKQHGTAWTKLTDFFQNRSANKIKNWYNMIITKRRRGGSGRRKAQNKKKITSSSSKATETKIRKMVVKPTKSPPVARTKPPTNPIKKRTSLPRVASATLLCENEYFETESESDTTFTAEDKHSFDLQILNEYASEGRVQRTSSMWSHVSSSTLSASSPAIMPQYSFSAESLPDAVFADLIKPEVSRRVSSSTNGSSARGLGSLNRSKNGSCAILDGVDSLCSDVMPHATPVSPSLAASPSLGSLPSFDEMNASMILAGLKHSPVHEPSLPQDLKLPWMQPIAENFATWSRLPSQKGQQKLMQAFTAQGSR